jgi:3-dehydro-4-phosphotetronate decarboxylase
VMRVGRLPLVPYFAPGDMQLADAVALAVRAAKGALLANHGPVIGGKDLENAVYAVEELEETAKLFLLLRNQSTQFLTEQQIQQLRERFPS